MTVLGLLTHRHSFAGQATSRLSRALGGTALLERLNKNRNTPECLHTEIVTVFSAGLERVLCEGCGHLSFRYLAKMRGKVDRSCFVRAVDQVSAPAHSPH